LAAAAAGTAGTGTCSSLAATSGELGSFSPPKTRIPKNLTFKSIVAQIWFIIIIIFNRFDLGEFQFRDLMASN